MPLDSLTTVKQTTDMLLQSKPPTKYGIALFPGFQSLDVFGPLDVLNILARSHPLELSVLSTTLEPVSTASVPDLARFSQSIVPTHTFETAPEDVEVLLVPGGAGTRDAENVQAVVDFVKNRYPKLRYLLTVCTGSALAARSGVLDGKEATSNKRAFEWVKSQGPAVKWIHQARWVTDGNIWTSSGISAGIDMIYAYVSDQYGEDVAADIAAASEYERQTDSKHDPFAKPQ